MRPYERRLKALAEKAGVSSDLCWTGQLSSAEMTWCYRKCSAFVMTSRIEACPNTVLEAMACGSVCIAADNAPLPELFSETALYYTPGDGGMLAARIKEVFSWDAAKREEVSAAAYERSHKFNWETAAKETLDLFERVSAQR
jgi:glycosyltransferase involved in cell wall biosynthesis